MMSMLGKIALALFLVFPSSGPQPNDKKQPKFIYPVIKGYGGVVPVSRAAQQPRRGTKFVIDITTGKFQKDANRGLDKTARYVNLYGHYDLLPGKDYHIVIVLHGHATAAAMNAESNPNRELIRQLVRNKVEVYVCGQALAHKGFDRQQVMAEVKVAVSAATVLINKQTEGFAYLPIH